ncbi:MAG: transporter [Longicatena sp.]
MPSKKTSEQRSLHIDNIQLLKSLDEEYKKTYERYYDYVITLNKSDADINIMLNIALERLVEGCKEHKKASLIIPKDYKEFSQKISKGIIFKEMKKKIRDQDYEKLIIASIWMVFTTCLVLFFLKNLMMQKFVVNYLVDVVVATLAGAIAMQNFAIKRRIIKRYNFGSLYFRIDAVALASCVFVKVISPSNFDVSYLILVISFFVMKKKIKPQFEEVLK